MRSWENEKTVVSVLSNHGDYPTDASATKETLQGQYVEEENVSIGGKSYTLNRISKYSVKVFADELDSVLSRLNPLLWDLYAKFAVYCLVACRLANNEHNQGFMGASAKGNEIDCSRMNSRQFFDPDSVILTTRRTSWVRVIPVVPAPPVTLNYLIDNRTALAQPYTTSEEESLVFLGWYNPATTPCSDMFQITLNTDLRDWEDIDFETVNTEQGDVIYEMKEPFILPPEEAGLIQTRYFRAGTDEMRPVGLWFKEAKNMRLMATP